MGSSALAWNSLLLMLAFGALALIGWLVVRHFRGQIRGGGASAVFTLEDLRRMRADGLINEVEYQAMRGALISDLRAPSTKRGEIPGKGAD